MKKKIKLTKAQAFVINLLLKGEVIAHNDVQFVVSDKLTQHKIDWRVWDALTNKYGLIRQESEYPFDYILTMKAKEL
jgi:hypothetical protein